MPGTRTVPSIEVEERAPPPFPWIFWAAMISLAAVQADGLLEELQEGEWREPMN